MLSDFTSDQHDPLRCGHCGVPLAGRFTPCPSCHRRPVDSFGARSAPPPSLKVPLKDPLDDPQPLVDSRLPTRKIWNPSSRALVNPYEFIEEPVVAVSAYQRLRQPLVLGASVLVVTSAVYLGFIHSNDSEVGTPIAVSGKVQHAKRPAARRHSAEAHGRCRAAVRACHPAETRDHRRPEACCRRRPRSPPPSSRRSPRPRPLPSHQSPRPPSPPRDPRPCVRRRFRHRPPTPPLSRRVASVGPEAKRNPGGQSGNPPDQPRADVSRHLRAARADLQQNNLSATRARLAAAIAAQPDNRDALNMRSTVSQREQQRDALLSLARGCGYIARWTCVSHNAGTALQIDSSSKEAQRLVTLAQRETELQMPPPAEPAPEPPPDTRDVAIHH